MDLDPEIQRQFAIEVVERLRSAGYQALWAGGCVRDLLLGHLPKDYDVATSATPDQVRQVFGAKRTLAIGASFGVMMVLGPKLAGQVEVATFREEADYTDGRRPGRVSYSTPELDAQRRDFTINGMFFDPIAQTVHDYVGGQTDLQAGLIRAIGNPRERFTEDKLRLLRAVRFAATFAFALDPATGTALTEMVPEIHIVSVERIREELCKMLLHPRRASAVELLRQTGLLQAVLPELPTDDTPEEWQLRLKLLSVLEAPSFPVALAALFVPPGDRNFSLPPPARWNYVGAAWEMSGRLKLSNQERHRIGALLTACRFLISIHQTPWSSAQPVLMNPFISDLIDLSVALETVYGGYADGIAFCRERLAWPPEKLNPPPLLTGNDLIAHGIPRGPQYATMLDAVRARQLDGKLASREAALAWIDAKGPHSFLF